VRRDLTLDFSVQWHCVYLALIWLLAKIICIYDDTAFVLHKNVSVIGSLNRRAIVAACHLVHIQLQGNKTHLPSMVVAGKGGKSLPTFRERKLQLLLLRMETQKKDAQITDGLDTLKLWQLESLC
jgi:hypothetical protein